MGNCTKLARTNSNENIGQNASPHNRNLSNSSANLPVNPYLPSPSHMNHIPNHTPNESSPNLPQNNINNVPLSNFSHPLHLANNPPQVLHPQNSLINT